jgi:hypothetical protein
MKTSLEVLNALRIASPCSAAWEEMVGDERVRHCRGCQQSVYNLSGMSAEEAVALLREKEGKVCVRLYRRTDGTVLTADCPVGRRQRLWRSVRRLAAVTAGWLGWVVLAECSQDRPRIDSSVQVRPAPRQPEEEAPGRHLMGKLCPVELKRGPNSRPE